MGELVVARITMMNVITMSMSSQLRPLRLMAGLSAHGCSERHGWCVNSELAPQGHYVGVFFDVNPPRTPGPVHADLTFIEKAHVVVGGSCARFRRQHQYLALQSPAATFVTLGLAKSIVAFLEGSGQFQGSFVIFIVELC